MKALLADAFMIFHLLWVLFMILGLPLGLWLRSPVLRWVHFGCMSVTAILAATGLYCPLTVWEEALRWEADPGFTYGVPFLARVLSVFLYPEISPGVLRTVSVTWWGLTLITMIWLPPGSPFRRTNRT